MIAPEQWYEYQKQYQKYGIEMKPESEYEARRARRQEAHRPSAAKATVLNLGSDRKFTFLLIAVSVVVLMMVVVIASYSAEITYDINRIKAENDVIIGEIDVQLLSSGTISYVEEKAKKELGMKAPDSKHCVYLSGTDAPEEGFADILKEKAYN